MDRLGTFLGASGLFIYSVIFIPLVALGFDDMSRVDQIAAVETVFITGVSGLCTCRVFFIPDFSLFMIACASANRYNSACLFIVGSIGTAVDCREFF